MYKLYYIVSYETDSYYIGMTKNKLFTRLINHKSACKRQVHNKLYNVMRKYGVDNFFMVLHSEYETKEECCKAEISAIKLARDSGHSILNISDGGEGGFNVVDVDSWIAKLKLARIGGKPFLGCLHTQETKNLCTIAGKKNKKYDTAIASKFSYKEAHKLYGISKTHYYRLKRASSND